MTPAGRPAGVDASTGRARERLLAEIGVLAVMVAWAGNFIVAKDAIGILPPVAFTFLRYVLASLTLFVLLRYVEGRISLPRPETLKIMVLGGLGFGCYQILWTVGLVTVPAGDSALLIAATPVFTAVIAVLLRSDALTPLRWLGVALSFLGVVVVIGSGVGIELTGSPLGFALTLGAALCWAFYTSVTARVVRRHSPLVLTTWATLGGVCVLAPVGIGQLVWAATSGTVTANQVPAVVLAVAYSGMLAAALANVIVLNAVRLLGPTRVTTLQALVPALAVVLAVVLLGEQLRIGQVIGGVIIVAGVALTRRGPRGRMPAGRTAAAQG